MKKKFQTKQDNKEFDRFDDLLRQVVNVPKSEIEKREQAEKKAKDARKARKF